MAAVPDIRSLPDAMSYEIMLDNGDRQIMLGGSDTDPSPEFEALRAWVQREAKRTRGSAAAED